MVYEWCEREGGVWGAVSGEEQGNGEMYSMVKSDGM